ncbi:unknown protein [Seminavis robusta]|uniref:Uncharacterized protein n=1 Tax=Seminavis robusta TaxID=568900 RepID=A0A9N8F0V0_9STRA|nr:unknown protein [Seminavis robusta]|eukprot:Sro2941_g340710.1 n/a (308) ;mRNA; f:3111-4034
MLESEKEDEDVEEEDEDLTQMVASRVSKVSQLLNGPATKERQKRGKNFTPEEDELLSKAWVSTTMDSRNGSDQRQSDFNKKLYSNFQDLVEDVNGDESPPCPPLPMDRKQKSVVARFATIKHGVNKFIGVVKMNPIRSGETPEQHLERCCAIYQETYGSKFLFLDCYHVLEECPKFSAAEETGKTKANGKKAKKHKRSQGKRQKALDDRIQRMIDNQGLGNNKAESRAVQEAGSVSEAIGQILTHLVDQVAVSQWGTQDKEEYFRNDALEKKLLQQRRILKLKKEIEEMQKDNQVSKSKSSSSSDEE